MMRPGADSASDGTHLNFFSCMGIRFAGMDKGKGQTRQERERGVGGNRTSRYHREEGRSEKLGTREKEEEEETRRLQAGEDSSKCVSGRAS